ncbi:MAG: hypothetical protein K2M82_04850 [Lachnospiraceae bacterium]|nr:hypothetical protein [Lachnospiraceae bacterium]
MFGCFVFGLFCNFYDADKTPQSSDSEIDSTIDTIVSTVEKVETVSEPQIIDLYSSDSDMDCKEYSIIVENRFGTYNTYHSDKYCSKLTGIESVYKTYYTFRTSSISAMEDYFSSHDWHGCYNCVDWDEEKEAEEQAILARERELRTEQVNLCSDSDTDGESFSVVLYNGVYHLKENCNKMIFSAEKDKFYYLITANNVNDIDEYFSSNNFKHCTECVKLEKETDTTTEEVSSTVSVTPTTQEYVFTVNNATYYFHSKSCGPSKQIADENREILTIEAYTLQDAINKMINQGYTYCGQCAR